MKRKQRKQKKGKMVKQGDIIKVNFDPIKGHEQAGYRPALVISNNLFTKQTNFVIACPISNTSSKFPLHIALDNRTKTTGVILCEHVKALDFESRGYKLIERIPGEILDKVLKVVKSEI